MFNRLSQLYCIKPEGRIHIYKVIKRAMRPGISQLRSGKYCLNQFSIFSSFGHFVSAEKTLHVVLVKDVMGNISMKLF